MAILGLSLANTAHATGGGPSRGIYLMLGGPLAGSTKDGFVLGGELSVVCLECFRDNPLSRMVKDPWWGGLYVDAVAGPSGGPIRVSVGPEFGFAFFGADAGAVFEKGSGGVGVTARALLTLAFVTGYARGIYQPEPGLSGEFGVLLKLPVINFMN